MDVVNIIIPIFTGIAGFFGKMILDYYWLRAPRLEFSQNVKQASNGRRKIPNTDLIEFTFVIHMQVSNTSSHDAYSFSFIGVDFTHQGKGKIDFHLLIPTKSIAIKSGDKTEHKIKFTYKTTRVNDDFKAHATTSRLNILNLKYTLGYKYKNAIGKEYHKTITKDLSNDYEDGVGLSF